MTEADRKTAESPYFLHMPEGECGPLFLDSPHSCTTYPADF
ncbi:MAG TPA: N-formylglutamate amidohydrolase, partial [Cupriavidus sp.]|nr:N-formylglutamate amidohydrolase [Cupriavidus sp.]